MLRKAFAGLLSALLIGVASASPALVNPTVASASALMTGDPDENNTLVGNFSDIHGSSVAQFGDTGGSAPWWGVGFAKFTATHSGTVTTLQEYADCGTGTPGTGNTCGTDSVVTLGLYDQQGSLMESCGPFAYPGTNTKWVGCDLANSITVSQDQVYWIASNVVGGSGDQNAKYGIGFSQNSTSGFSQACGAAGSESTPGYTTPPASVLTTSNTDCSGAGLGTGSTDGALAATGTFSPADNSTAPAAGTSQPASQTTSIAANKVRLYRFNDVAGSSFSKPVSRIHVFIDSTSTAVGWNAAIYNDNNGTPTYLIAECNASAYSNKYVPAAAGQWNTCSVDPTDITAGSSYWIAVWNADGTNALVLDDQTAPNSNNCLTSSTQTNPFVHGSNFVTTGDAGCSDQNGLMRVDTSSS